MSGREGKKIGNAMVLFLVVLTNNGPPSGATDYTLGIKSSVLSAKNLHPFMLRPGARSLSIYAEPEDKKIAVVKNGFLYDKTLGPVKTGETVCGWLAFTVPNAKEHQLMANAKWTLSFYDGFGNLQERMFDTSKWNPKKTIHGQNYPCAEQVYQQ